MIKLARFFSGDSLVEYFANKKCIQHDKLVFIMALFTKNRLKKIKL